MDHFVGSAPRQFQRVRDAIDAAKAGDAIYVDPGDYADQTCIIDKSGLSIINKDVTRDPVTGVLSNLAAHNMILRPIINKAQTDAAALELGITAAEVSALWATDKLALHYRQTPHVFSVGGKTSSVAVTWHASDQMGYKGIFTIRAGVRDIHIEGIEFGWGKIVSSNNGAGIRAQGIGLSVHRCFFHDCQDGVLSTAQFRDDPAGEFINFKTGGRYTRTGYIFITESQALNNGENGGLVHDYYLGPCARQLIANSLSVDCKAGHHNKHFQGGGVAISIGNNMPDTPTTNLLRSHCGVDSSSGHLYMINNFMMKQMTSHSGTNISHGMVHSNYRDMTPAGNIMVALGNKSVTNVTKKTSHFHILDYTSMKPSPGDTIPLPLPMPNEGLIDFNVALAAKAGYATDFANSSAPGVIIGPNNRSGFSEDGDITQMPLPIMVGSARVTKQSFDALLDAIGAAHPAAKQYTDRSIAWLKKLDVLDIAPVVVPGPVTPPPPGVPPVAYSPAWSSIVAADVVDDGLITKDGVWTFEPLTALDARVLLDGEPTKNAGGSIVSGILLLISSTGTIFCQSANGAVRYWGGRQWQNTPTLPVKPGAPPPPVQTALEIAQAEIILLKAQLVASAEALAQSAAALVVSGEDLAASQATLASSNARNVAGLAAANAGVIALTLIPPTP